VLAIENIRTAIGQSKQLAIENKTTNEAYEAVHSLSGRQIKMILDGSLINVVRQRRA
jgi:aconitate hydratase